jgi:hypothetical protein
MLAVYKCYAGQKPRYIQHEQVSEELEGTCRKDADLNTRSTFYAM